MKRRDLSLNYYSICGVQSCDDFGKWIWIVIGLGTVPKLLSFFSGPFTAIYPTWQLTREHKQTETQSGKTISYQIVKLPSVLLFLVMTLQFIIKSFSKQYFTDRQHQIRRAPLASKFNSVKLNWPTWLLIDYLPIPCFRFYHPLSPAWRHIWRESWCADPAALLHFLQINNKASQELISVVNS